jgi:hypothetical protein
VGYLLWLHKLVEVVYGEKLRHVDLKHNSTYVWVLVLEIIYQLLREATHLINYFNYSKLLLKWKLKIKKRIGEDQSRRGNNNP